jgi:hypothetical protein
MRVPLTQGFYKARSIIANAQREVNLYPEKNPDDSPVPVTHYPTAGLRLLNGVPLFTPPVPVTPTTQTLWVAGSSCELLGFDLLTSGTTPPAYDVEGSLTGLTGPQGNPDSITWAVALDSSKNVICIATVLETTAPNVWKTSILVFPPNATGNIAPLRTIAGTSTLLDTFQDINPPTLSYMGLCLDPSNNIYAAPYENFILKFAAGSDGNVAPSYFVPVTANKLYASLFYDAANQWIWAASESQPGIAATIEAYNLAGVQQRLITDTANLQYPHQVWVRQTDGSIFVAEGNGGGLFVYAPGANRASSPTRTIYSASTQFPGGVASDSNGLIYLSSYRYGSTPNIIEVFAADADGAGTAVPLRTMSATALSQTQDGTATSPFQIFIG